MVQIYELAQRGAKAARAAYCEVWALHGPWSAVPRLVLSVAWAVSGATVAADRFAWASAPSALRLGTAGGTSPGPAG